MAPRDSREMVANYVRDPARRLLGTLHIDRRRARRSNAFSLSVVKRSGNHGWRSAALSNNCGDISSAFKVVFPKVTNGRSKVLS
jgi:hypothetical protein